MKKKVRVLFFGVLLILSCSKSGFTASFDYFGINHSIFEDGRNAYRISFNINDINGNTINQYVSNSLELMYEPSGSQIIYDTRDVEFHTGNEIYGRYNIETGELSYDPVAVVTEHYGPVNGILANGEYRLTANIITPLSGEHTIEITKQWNHTPVTLPIISYNSFRISNDNSGNFILEWDAPTGLNDSTHSRVSIDVFDQQTLVGDIYLKVPTDLGRITVPAEIVQQVEKWGGDRYEIMVNLRTNDGNERTYSNRKVINSLRTNVVGNILYDDFSGESLDAEKWSGYSNNENPVIVNGALELAISGNDTKLTNNLNFPKNQGIISIQTKVKIANESYVSSGASGKFRIGATWYNDNRGPGSGKSHNLREGDVWAEFRLALDDSHTLKAIAEILRIDNAEDTSETTLFYQEFNTSINFDTEYTTSMGVENGVFVLTLDDETYSYPIETPMYIPYNGEQVLTSRLYLDQGEHGLFKAILDDVYVSKNTPSYDASGYWLFDVKFYSTENLDNPDWNEETTWQSAMQGRNEIKQDNSTFSIENWFYGNVYNSSTYQHYAVISDAGGSTELTLAENDPMLGWIYSEFHTIWFNIDSNSEELEGEYIFTFWKILPGSAPGNILIDEENPTYAKGVFTGIRLNPEPVVLTALNPNFTVTNDNSPALIYGTNQANNITLESGVYAQLINFTGSNTVTIQSDSGIFSVSRSGATVTFEGTYGTMLKMPATKTAQTIVFDDKSLTLKIDAGSVMLDSQVVGTTRTSL